MLSTANSAVSCVIPTFTRALVAMHVIAAIRDGRAFGQTRKIVDVHLPRLTLLAPFPPVILELPDPLLLLCVHGDHRFFALPEPLGCLINVSKLPAPVGVGFPLLLLLA